MNPLAQIRVPGGPRWAYVFGSALLALLLAQLASGLALGFNYSASLPAAWASVARIEQTPLGHLFRGLHAQGATFLLVVATLHLLQTAMAGAFREQRAATWWLGLALLALLFAFCLSGSLLPWDERGYWATRVTAGIIDSAPLAGPALSRLILGGREFGNLTLARFYAVHATLLPLLLVLLGTLHVAAVRRHGVQPLRAGPEQSFWPGQALLDATFAVLVLAALLAAAVKLGAPLTAPADPSGAANPRPEWYFRPLFELLKLMPIGLEAFGTFFVPLLAAAFLVAMPYVRSQKAALGVLLAGMAGSIALCAASYREDAASSDFARQEALSRGRAQKALKLARSVGVPPEGALALLNNQPDERGGRLFARVCTDCHAEGRKAPRLDGLFSRDFIRAALAHPEQVYATAKLTGMEGYQKLGEQKLNQLVEYLYALRSRPAD
ncbi:MAG TPA: cytochrome b N-terminal domain-containing protein, partial [Myxococcales bacterium]|nr:cytochrome b N-terminal domain-containing protein [Myxococcales bacterium]